MFRRRKYYYGQVIQSNKDMERKRNRLGETDVAARRLDSCEKNVSFHEDDSEDKKRKDEPLLVRLKHDKINILLLVFLYVLQGIPLGLSYSVPLMLQNRNISYKDQAIFSFAYWPFSVKILWAPLVDSLHCSFVGRRKSWLIPTQYMIGLAMLVLSRNVDTLLGSSSSVPNVFPLMAAFFLMNMLAATQDIAVDGWALTMLSRQNVGYASTCNSVGQTAGFFLSNVVFLALESESFCNKYLRSSPQTGGIVTLASFLMFWGYVFFIATTLVAILKKERNEFDSSELGILETYKMLYRILGLRSIWTVIALLMTCKIGFAAADGVTGLKLIDAGIKKEHMGLIAVPVVPLQIFLPIVISRYTAGPRPLSVFLKAYPYRLLFGAIFAALLWWTTYVKYSDGSFPSYYYVVITLAYVTHQLSVYCMFVAVMAFFAKVSDPAIGGTYMTLLNTVCNLGGNWPPTLALWWVDSLTTKICENAPDMSCDTKELAAQCEKAGHHCAIVSDGYYVESVACILIGLMWLRWGKPAAQRLQKLPPTAWTIS